MAKSLHFKVKLKVNCNFSDSKPYISVWCYFTIEMQTSVQKKTFIYCQFSIENFVY